MTNYQTLNPNRTDKAERVTLWQNKLMQKLKAFKCEFSVNNGFMDCQAMVSYREREGLEPFIQVSQHYAKETSKSGVMAMLHELGHVIHYRKFDNFLHYVSIGNGEVEVTAWENAFHLARQIGFKPNDFQEMHDYALECLYTYKNWEGNFENHRDLASGHTATPMLWSEAVERIDKVLAVSVKHYNSVLFGS